MDHCVEGLTLIELMATVVVLALLVGLGLPALQTYSQRGYRGEAQADLMACALALERWAGVRFSYQGAADTDSDGLGDADEGLVAAEVCAPRSVAGGRYLITVRGRADGFVLSAHPQGSGPMAGDGFMSLDEAVNRQWDRNDNAHIAPDEKGWEM